MRIVVTGASGFLGSVVCRKLLALGHYVIAPGRINAGTSEHQDWYLGQELLLDNIDVIVHAAAYLPKYYADSSEATRCLMDNSIATLKLLEQAQTSKVKMFVYVSSGNIYDCHTDVAVENSHIYPSVRAPFYLVSKMAADVFADYVRQTSEMKVATVRPSYIYGPGMKPAGLVPRLTLKLKQDQILTFKDIGNYRLDLVHVDDVAEVIGNLIAKNMSETFNVGGGAVPTLTVAQTLAELLNKEYLVNNTQNTVIEFSHAALDITKAQELLGYQPRSLRVGLQSYLDSL